MSKFAILVAVVIVGCGPVATVEVNNEIPVFVYVDVPQGAVQVTNNAVVPQGAIEQTVAFGVPTAPSAEGYVPVGQLPSGTAPDAGVDTTTTASVPVEPAPITVNVSRVSVLHNAVDQMAMPGMESVNVRTFALQTSGGTVNLDTFVAFLGANTNAEMASECRLHAWPDASKCVSAAVPDAWTGVMAFQLQDDCQVGSEEALFLDVDCDIREDALVGISLDPWFEADGGSVANTTDGAAVTFVAAPHSIMPWTWVVEPAPVALGGGAPLVQILNYGHVAVMRFTVTATERDVAVTGADFAVRTYNEDAQPAGIAIGAPNDGTSACLMEAGGSTVSVAPGVCFPMDSLLADFVGKNAMRTYLSEAYVVSAGTTRTFEIVVNVSGNARSGDRLDVRGPKLMLDGRWYDTPTFGITMVWHG